MPELAKPEHEIICGMIGMGKSFWVLYKIVIGLLADRPCCYIDPKGDTYRSLLWFLASTMQGQEIWRRLRHRILLLNPVSTSGFRLAFNAIEPLRQFSFSLPDRVALLADNLTSHIRRQSGFEANEAMRMQNILSAAIGLLVQGGQGRWTLAELPYLFLPSYHQEGKGSKLDVYNPFATSLLGPQVDHYGTLSFWKLQWPTMLPNDRREWVQSTEGRIYPYLFDSNCLMTTCAVQNARLDFRRVVQDGYWLFVNIPYPLLSEQVTTLIGNLIITKLLYACMEEPTGRDYRLILDEARFFNTGPLDRLLETSRSGRLWLTLVVQSLNQLCRSREGRIDYALRDTVLNLMRYWSVFNLTQPDDAQLVSELMYPVTGYEIRGIDPNGRPDYMPGQATRELYTRRLMALQKRQMILYDKLGRLGPQPINTPEVMMDEVEDGRVAMFEAEHLQLTGRPASEIMREVEGRRQEVEAVFKQGTGSRGEGEPAEGAASRRVPKGDFRGM